MNSYARPDVRYCRDYLHSKCKQGLFGILEARLLTSQVRRLTGGSARALLTGNLLTREMSTIRANKMTKNRDLILNVNRPVKFVVRFFAFCGQTIQNIDLVRKTKVVWLEILNKLVPFNIFLGKNYFLDFPLFSYIF